MINLLQSLKRSLAYAVIWILFMILDCVLSVNERHKHCAPTFSCGHKIDLYYPFWTSDREECGHPDFKVNCSDGFAELTISAVKLRILEMNSKSRIIRLARMDYINDLCPNKPENATLNNQVLPFSEDTELRTFYYRCRLSPKVDVTNSGHIRQLDCGDDTGRPSFSVSSHLYSRKREIINELRESCGSIVNVPVSRSALRIEERNQSAEALTKALEKGFELSFNRDCSRCRRSKGACGYNITLGGFVCYCINKPHKHTCLKNGLSKPAKIGIGFVCGFLGATLLAACLLCFYIRRRKKLAAQYTNKGLSATPPTSISRSNHALMPSSISNLANRSVDYGVQVFSYEELEEATDHFSRELGDGGFSTVYTDEDQQTV